MKTLQDEFELRSDDLIFVKFKPGRRDPIAVEFILLNEILFTTFKDSWEHWPEISQSRNQKFLLKNGGLIPHTIMFGPSGVDFRRFYRVKSLRQSRRVAFVRVTNESFTYKDLERTAKEKDKLFWWFKFLDTRYGRSLGIWEVRAAPSIDWGGPIYPWNEQFYQWVDSRNKFALKLLNKEG